MDRNLALEFVRATEAAAIAAAHEKGRGSGRAADEAATRAMRDRLNDLEMQGRIVTGEGEKDQRSAESMLELREEVGKRAGPIVDIAVDPLEGTSLTKNNQPGSLAVLAGAVHDDGYLIELPPAFYANKIAVGFPGARELIDLDAPVEDNLRSIATRLDKPVTELSVVVLDRPRHEQLIRDIRAVGARATLIVHGDVGAALETAIPSADVDVAMGIGGLTEGYLAAVALRALGGSIVQRFWFKGAADRADYEQRAERMGFTKAVIKSASEQDWWHDEIVQGESFVALTGVTDGPIVRGVHFGPHNRIETHSLVARSKSKTVRFVNTWHHAERK